jgi:hypothetical protein
LYSEIIEEVDITFSNTLDEFHNYVEPNKIEGLKLKETLPPESISSSILSLKQNIEDVKGLLKNGYIENVSFEEILASIDWKRSHMCIPQHYESKNQYMLLLPETKWKLTDSDFTFELEILFTNGKIEIAQEMSGLWNRIEWFEDYLKRKTT